jgi:hypothetical protein
MTLAIMRSHRNWDGSGIAKDAVSNIEQIRSCAPNDDLRSILNSFVPAAGQNSNWGERTASVTFLTSRARGGHTSVRRGCDTRGHHGPLMLSSIRPTALFAIDGDVVLTVSMCHCGRPQFRWPARSPRDVSAFLLVPGCPSGVRRGRRGCKSSSRGWWVALAVCERKSSYPTCLI